MQMKLKEVPNALVLAYAAGVNTYLWGKPGIGKTETVMLFVGKMKQKIEDFKVWFFYGPSMGPTDIQASMPEVETHTLQVYNNGALPNAYTHPDAKGVVFIGEAANTDPMTFKLLQKYVNGEDMNGVLRKPDGVRIICDGNRLQDKSGVQQQGRAMMNRFQHLDVYTDAHDNTEFAKRNSWHPTVQQFFKDQPDMIDNYEDVFEVASGTSSGVKQRNEDRSNMAEEGKRGIWASMRGWKRICDLETAADSMGIDIPPQVIIGSVGSGVGRQYLATRSFMGKLASVDDICNDPDNVVIPTKLDELYAQCVVLAVKCNQKQLPAVAKFSKRLTGDMVVLLIQRMMTRKGDFALIGTPEYAAWMADKQLSELYMAK